MRIERYIDTMSSTGKWAKGCGSCHLTDADADALASDVAADGTEAREKVEG